MTPAVRRLSDGSPDPRWVHMGGPADASGAGRNTRPVRARASRCPGRVPSSHLHAQVRMERVERPAQADSAAGRATRAAAYQPDASRQPTMSCTRRGRRANGAPPEARTSSARSQFQRGRHRGAAPSPTRRIASTRKWPMPQPPTRGLAYRRTSPREHTNLSCRHT